MADAFPLYLPREARRLFQSESLLRRFAQAAQWTEDSKLLELHGSLGGLALSKALKCPLTVVEPDQRSADVVRERARMAGIAPLVTVLNQSSTDASALDDGYGGIFCLGRVLGAVDMISARFRPLLSESGRLALTVMVKVGRSQPDAALKAWTARLGHALPSPRDAMMLFEAQGFEPEICESLGEPELDDFYKEVETLLSRAPDPDAKPLLDEIALHKSCHGKTGVTYAVLIGRRKEPGEKPPLSRDGG